MLTLIRSVALILIPITALAQHPCSVTTSEKTRINKLVIESRTLPAAERMQLVRSFQQKSYYEPEIPDRLQISLHNLGYFKAVIRDSDVSFTSQADKTVDIIAKFEPGAQYRLGEIQFQNATVFPPAQLRQAFALERGDLLNSTRISEGLDKTRQLYSTRGYINMVVNPVLMIDESNHIINLSLQIDQGSPYDFGQLNLEGVEPHPGAAKALLASWKPLEGKRFNSTELQNWYRSNRSTWHALPEYWLAINFTQQQTESRKVNVTLTQWCP